MGSDWSLGSRVMGIRVMIGKLVGKRGIIGGRWALRAVVWAGLGCVALYVNTATLAGQPGSKAEAADKAERFIHPELARIPMWSEVEPGKLDIFRKPTPADPGDEVKCLALNIYFEARSEPEAGKLAVGHVVMNRVGSKRFPGTVCDVVRQGGELRRYRCQFSWWCDGRSDTPRNKREWQRSSEIALAVYWCRTEDPTAGALWYHADYVKPSWRKAFKRGPQIGRHIFYSQAPHKTRVASRLSQK